MPYSVRRPTLDDAESLLQLMVACDIPVLGKADTTLADVNEQLREPELDLTRDAWIAVGPGGELEGSAFVFCESQGDTISLDLYAHPDHLDSERELWQLAEDRAMEIGRTLGHQQIKLDTGVHRADHRRQELAAQGGFTRATSFHRMRIDFDGDVTAPQLPGGVRIDIVGEDQHLRQVAVDLDNETFDEHFGFTAHSLDWWESSFAVSQTSGWQQTRILTVDDEPAALLIASNQYVEDENCGYVGTLGVRKPFRGRGLGRLLLLDAFARDYAGGRIGTMLHVDVNNVTPALGLYESAGMRTVMVMDGFRKTVPVQ